MRDLTELDRSRSRDWELRKAGMPGDSSCGCFVMAGPGGRDLAIIASSGEGWEHVSVTVRHWPDRCPTWKEMDWVKRTFFRPDEAVVQYHPPEVDHISVHHGCLHLWRPTRHALPLPPKWMVA
jgi:hypothetical protein